MSNVLCVNAPLSNRLIFSLGIRVPLEAGTTLRNFAPKSRFLFKPRVSNRKSLKIKKKDKNYGKLR